MGMMQALELVEDPRTKEASPRKAAALLEAAREEGLLIGTGGLFGHVIRIAPQMLLSEAELDDGLARLSRAAEKVN
jgi:4-aminobutyrate aminotransferase